MISRLITPVPRKTNAGKKLIKMIERVYYGNSYHRKTRPHPQDIAGKDTKGWVYGHCTSK